MTSTIDEIIAAARKVGENYVKSWSSLGYTWFDHRYDWTHGPNNWAWCERGILGFHFIHEGDRVLDLCCGDGMFSGLIFSRKASLVHAMDVSPEAIALARELYASENVEFFVGNVLKDAFPSSGYNVITMFAALEHFTAVDVNKLLHKITRALAPGGILFGSTLLSAKQDARHAVQFKSAEDIEALLGPHFKKVKLWATVWNERRTEIYFLCEEAVR